MDCKQLVIKRLPQLDRMPLPQVSKYLDSNVEHAIIDCAPWQDLFPYIPFCSAVVAVSSTRLYVFFSVISKDLRAVNTCDLDPVAEDSCVEFFIQVPGSEEYWNFEFNCIGVLNGSHRAERNSPTRLTAAQLKSINRYSSCGSEAIEEQDGTFCWDLVASIPLQLMGLDGDNLPDYVTGNLYKCGSKTKHPHYVSWNAIDGDKPNFHRPDCFGRMWFHEPDSMVEELPIKQSPQPKGRLKRLLGSLFWKK